MAEQMLRLGWPTRVPAPRIPPPGGHHPFFTAKFPACIDGAPRFSWPLRQIEQLWQGRQATPKFAFYSANAIHDTILNPRVAHKRAALAAYDGLLREFLEKFLRRHPNTIVLLRGDHGQQDGPEMIEFDMQVEHRLPWGRLLVPLPLVPNASRLRTNAERLISPFDLHATLHALMLRGNSTQTRRMPTAKAMTSNAAIDLLLAEVPALRTCRQAQIPEWLCPCQHERLASGVFSYAPANGIFKFDQVFV